MLDTFEIQIDIFLKKSMFILGNYWSITATDEQGHNDQPVTELLTYKGYKLIISYY